MPNITVLVREDVYEIARAYAKQNGTSISALVADFLYSLRNQSRKHPKRTPRGVIYAHRNRLKKTPGRASFEPRTLWDYSIIVNSMLESAKNEQKKADKRK